MHAAIKPCERQPLHESLAMATRWSSIALVAILSFAHAANAAPPLMGFAEADATPVIGGERPVWIAGYGHGRPATGVHDPIMVRALALDDGVKRIAFVAVDVVGLHYPLVKRIRARLVDWDYVVVAASHNHEGPDTMGLWGPNPFVCGVEETYLDLIVERCVAVVSDAGDSMSEVTAAYGTAEDESLLGEKHKHNVKDGVLRVIRFRRRDGRDACVWAQWSCHPELQGSRNTQLTADFPWATVAALRDRYGCPVAYFTGMIGGLMAPPKRDYPEVTAMSDGDAKAFRRTELYGREVAELAARAIDAAEPIELTPFVVAAKPIAIPLDNPHFHLARTLGVLRREGVRLSDDFEVYAPDDRAGVGRKLGLETEVAYLRLGALEVACLPGEVYPEMLRGAYPAVAAPGVDYPDAALEKPIFDILKGEKVLLLGLANDEIGYIIPKRQWDVKKPFAYGRVTEPQYGEINSCGPEVARIISQALENRVRDAWALDSAAR